LQIWWKLSSVTRFEVICIWSYSQLDVLDFLINLLIFFSLRASENIKNIKLRIASIVYNFKASNWAQFLSDLQNSNCFEKLRFSSINFTKKFLFCVRACCVRKMHIYIFINYASQRWNLELFCIFCCWFSLRVNSNRIKLIRQKIEPKPNWIRCDKNRFEIELNRIISRRISARHENNRRIKFFESSLTWNSLKFSWVLLIHCEL
jgi:hypothetical protein